MRTRPVSELPTGPDWLYEIKWDGYRALALKHGDDVRLLSRNDKDLGKQFPGVVQAVSRIAAQTAVLDGEIIAVSDDGRPSFQGLQNRKTEAHQIVFFAFDLLQVDDQDLRDTPLVQRRTKLAKLIGKSGVKFSDELVGDARDIAEGARKIGLEGVMAKRRQGRYVSGENNDWVKLKLNHEQEFVVGGYSPNGASFDALVIGHYDGKDLVCCGRVRNGFKGLSRTKLAPLLRAHPVEVCPFVNLPMGGHGRWGEGITAAEMAELRWVKPRVVVQVAFVEWTRAGLLRHPTYRGVREDKRARDVRGDPSPGQIAVE